MDKHIEKIEQLLRSTKKTKRPRSIVLKVVKGVTLYGNPVRYLRGARG